MKKLLIAIAVGAVVGVVWYRRRRDAVIVVGGDHVPALPAAADALVHDASQDSFPASDPPPYWAREPADGDAGA